MNDVSDLEATAIQLSATLPRTSRYCFQYQGETRPVILGFQVTDNRLWSYDRGMDPLIGQGRWGALLGPYEFQRVAQE